MSSPSAMNPQRCNVSNDPQTICPSSSSQFTAVNELLLKLPIDLVIEIFSRLPLKSIARCRCVSKQCSSVLRRPDFTELFLTKSLARPKLLVARQEVSELIFFSSPSQPQNPDESLSLIATVDHHMSVPFESVNDVSSCCVNGYVCIEDFRMSKGRETEEAELVYVICNPSTGQCLALPKINTTREVTLMKSFLGYDPIEKKHKVLATIKQDDGAVVHQVLTVRGSGNSMTWRITECGGIHLCFPGPNNICINGVQYYTARASNDDCIIGCFDVRSEKYSFVKAMDRGMFYATLINFQGKLASLTAQPHPFYLDETSTSLEMWILEDPEKHEWSKRIFNLPPTWKDVVAAGELYFVGVTDTNEFVISPVLPPNPFHVYYYNFVKESIRRVDIQGMGALEMDSVVLTYLNHVEDVKLM